MPRPPIPAQAAVIPYRVRDGRGEVLLVTTRGRGRWIVPKGNVEPDLGERRSAEREAFEEAGVTGLLGPAPFGHYRHGRAKAAVAVAVYLLRVDAEAAAWPERGARRRRWVPAEKAAERVGLKGLQGLLRAVAEALRPDRRLASGALLPRSPWPFPPWP